MTTSNLVNTVSTQRNDALIERYENRQRRQRALELAIDAISKCALKEGSISITELAAKFLKFLSGERAKRVVKRKKK